MTMRKKHGTSQVEQREDKLSDYSESLKRGCGECYDRDMWAWLIIGEFVV